MLIDDQKAIESLKSIDNKGKDTESGFSKLASGGAKIGLGVVAAGAVVGGALVGMTNKITETTGAIQDSADRTGMSAEAFQKWSFAAEQSGMSAETLEGAMIKQQKVFAEAKTGSEKAGEAYAKLGIDISSIGSSSEAFDQVMAKMAGMTDESERNALANDIFGKSYAQLTPLLNEGAEGMDALKQQAVDLGGVMSNEAVSSGEALGDTLDQMKLAGAGVFNTLATQLMPMIQTFADWVIANMPAIQSVVSTVFDVIGNVIGVAVDIFNNTLLPAFVLVYDWVQANMPMIQEVVRAVFENMKMVWEETLRPVFDAMMGVLQTVWDVFMAAWPSIQNVLGIAFEAMKLAWDVILKPAIDALVEIINFLKQKFDENMPAIQVIFEAMAANIQWAWETYIRPAIEAIGGILSWLYDKFGEYILPLVGMVIDWFGQIASGIGDRMAVARGQVDTAVQGIIGFFDGLGKKKDDVVAWFEEIRRGMSDKINAARNAVSAAVEAIKGFFNFTFSWPNIPMPSFAITPSGWKIGDLLKGSIPDLGISWNAAGGIFTKPTIFDTANGLQGVGEAGPEAILPLSKLPELLGLDKQQGQSIDYARMADAMVSAISRSDLRVEMDRRQFGRLVGELA